LATTGTADIAPDVEDHDRQRLRSSMNARPRYVTSDIPLWSPS
jgi:hypothetical protein